MFSFLIFTISDGWNFFKIVSSFKWSKNFDNNIILYSSFIVLSMAGANANFGREA